jgi:hypothetical protein
MTDAELLQCLERFPPGEPITLYHVDATGGFVQSLADNNGQVNLRTGEFWLTTNVETRTGFKGGAGLDGGIVGFKLDRRFVLLLADLSQSQRQAAQTEKVLKLLFNAEIAIPRVNFEGGGKGVALPEGDVNIALRMTQNAPEFNRLFQLSIQQVSRLRYDGTRAAGSRLVAVRQWTPINGGRPTSASVGEEPQVPFDPIAPIYGRYNARMEAFGGGGVLFLQLVATALSFFNDRKQQDAAKKALEQEADNIDRHRIEVPTEGVLLRFAYLTKDMPTLGNDSVFKTMPEFQYLDVLYGQTPDEALKNKLYSPDGRELREGGGSYSYQERWVPPLIAPSVTDLHTPWSPKVAVGTFAPDKAVLQQVEFDDFWGFDDARQMRLSVPADVTPKFIILTPPSVIKWAGPSVYEASKLLPPLVTRRAASGENLVAIDLDPDLAIVFDDVAAVPVFPADDDTDDLFATTPPTHDDSHVLSIYYNFNKVRWVRPENITVLQTIEAVGRGTSQIQSTRVQAAGAPAASPAASPKPDPAYIPKAWELAPRDRWGTTTPAVPPDTPRVYIAVPGDSLSKIAGKFYGDPNQWRKIYEANKKKIDPNTKWVYPGQKLVVPDETAPTPSTPPTPSPVDPAMPVA